MDPTLPPPSLRLLVDDRSADAGHFLRIGRQLQTGIVGAVEAAGRSADELGAVLDFGCGCGARRWGAAGHEIHGCDYNPAPGRLVWSQPLLPA